MALDPKNIGFLKDTVKTMFKYDVNDNGGDLKIAKERPSSAIRLKQTIDKVAVLLHVLAVKAGDWNSCKSLEYLPLLLNHYLNPICINARKSMKCSSSGLPQPMPERNSIAKLVKHLDGQLLSMAKNSR